MGVRSERADDIGDLDGCNGTGRSKKEMDAVVGSAVDGTLGRRLLIHFARKYKPLEGRCECYLECLGKPNSWVRLRGVCDKESLSIRILRSNLKEGTNP